MLEERDAMLLAVSTVLMGSKTLSIVATVLFLLWLGRRWFIDLLSGR